MLTIVAILNLIVYATIGGIVVTEEITRRKLIRNKGISSAQKRDIKTIEKFEKAKSLSLSSEKGMLKIQNKLNSKKFKLKLAKHILKAVKKKRFVYNRRYSIEEITTKNPTRRKDLRKIALNQALSDYYELKSEISNSRKSSKYARKADLYKRQASQISSKYPKEQTNRSFYERIINLPSGEEYVDHRTSMNNHDQRFMHKFSEYIQEHYKEPKNKATKLVEFRFNGLNKTSVSCPNQECLEYGKILLLSEALELAKSEEYGNDVFPIKILQADTKAGKYNEGRIKPTEIATIQTIDELALLFKDSATSFYAKYIKDREDGVIKN